jgi:hypothetical protein
MILKMLRIRNTLISNMSFENDSSYLKENAPESIADIALLLYPQLSRYMLSTSS